MWNPFKFSAKVKACETKNYIGKNIKVYQKTLLATKRKKSFGEEIFWPKVFLKIQLVKYSKYSYFKLNICVVAEV